ncbi:hypothetical protein [Streptomyces sp. NBC_00076]|uniref:hypothetical protein n=1 Tax=Streptomyces sp. NBC_00076 TaxID=2975642 RepID=UPI0032544600
MPADEVTHGIDVDASRVRTGPRHAAPKKPLFTRFHVPAGKAIALAAMPTAVLMGMGFTPTLALADDQPASKSLTADEYKDCLTALEDGASPSASPSPSTSASGDDKDSSDGSSDSSGKGDSAEPNPAPSSDGTGSSGDSSSSDSGSGEKADPTPSPSASSSGESDSASEASPSPSESGGNLLEGIGDAITGIFTGGTKATDSASPTPSATPSASASPDSSDDGSDGAASTDKGTSGSLTDTTKKLTDTVGDTVKGTTDGASKTVEDTTEAVEKAVKEAGGAVGKAASPSPSASSTTDPEDCPAATDDEGGVDNKILLPDDPWYLEASKLTLKGADYQGVVEVRTASGATKKVLKYVISNGTEIDDLHQIVKDKQSGKTYHVQAAKGSTSTITGGKTVMYTESISGNLLGLLPLTFDPEHPPPLNLPEIMFTNVKVTQAGQFGGTLHIPGLHNYITG